MNYKLGIDVGGTFTDFILISDAGKTTIHKTLSTPQDPSIGVISGIYDLAVLISIDFNDLIKSIVTIVHGTTVATNALLTLKGAKTALITTKGFRDALEMRRGIREEQYNNHYRNVQPLVPRFLRFTVNERIGTNGNILKSLDLNELDSVCEKLNNEEVEAVAVCYMNSFANHVHEEQTVKYLKKRLKDKFITASCEVLPTIRFYERVSTTVVNAYIGPVVANYLDNLTKKLDEINFVGKLLIVQSNGGVVAPEIVRKSPAVTVLSGPAAAPTAGIFYANLLGKKNCITVDMGGTSFDASIVVNNQCLNSTEGEINRYKIALPSLDIVTIGAGGGSIGWLNSGGLLQMGPQSAGASPGPVCYDQGGREPACTDANLILGYVNPDYFAGGKIRLNYERTEKLLEDNLASKLGLSVLETAAGMYRIINSNMAQGVRQVSIEKGHDPREFLFIVAGGAGAIHAGEICKELEIPMFVVPNTASIFCAAGMLLGDLKHDYVMSFLSTFSKLKENNEKNSDGNDLIRLYCQMRNTGVDTLIAEGVKESSIEFEPVMDLRYIGQYHEVQLPVGWNEIEALDINTILNSFHDEHNRLYGYCLRGGAEVECINIRLRCIGKIDRPKFLSEDINNIPIENAIKGRRRVFIPETNSMNEVPVYDGDLEIGENYITGPAIIEKINTSIFISENYNCFIDKYCSFIVYSKKAFPNGWTL